MKYSAKPRVVDAQQYDGSFDLDFLRDDESIRAGAPDGSRLVLRSAATAYDVHLADWVIRDADGDFRILSDEAFRAYYVVPDPIADEDRTPSEVLAVERIHEWVYADADRSVLIEKDGMDIAVHFCGPGGGNDVDAVLANAVLAVELVDDLTSRAEPDHG